MDERRITPRTPSRIRHDETAQRTLPKAEESQKTSTQVKKHVPIKFTKIYSPCLIPPFLPHTFPPLSFPTGRWLSRHSKFKPTTRGQSAHQQPCLSSMPHPAVPPRHQLLRRLRQEQRGIVSASWRRPFNHRHTTKSHQKKSPPTVASPEAAAVAVGAHLLLLPLLLLPHHPPPPTPSPPPSGVIFPSFPPPPTHTTPRFSALPYPPPTPCPTSPSPPASSSPSIPPLLPPRPPLPPPHSPVLTPPFPLPPPLAPSPSSSRPTRKAPFLPPCTTLCPTAAVAAAAAAVVVVCGSRGHSPNFFTPRINLSPF